MKCRVYKVVTLRMIVRCRDGVSAGRRLGKQKLSARLHGGLMAACQSARRQTKHH